MSAKTDVAVAAATITGNWILEKAQRRRDAAPGQVPRSPEQFNTAWLTSALCADHPGAAVIDFTVGAGTDGTSARRPLDVVYNEAGQTADLPTTLYTKSTPSLKTRLMYGLNRLGIHEGNFYLRLRPELEIETPNAYYAETDLASGCSMLIIDNLSVTRKATFGDPCTTDLDRDQAADMVALMATYHAAFWESPRLVAESDWLIPEAEWQRRLTDALGYRRLFHKGLRRSREVMPSSLASQESQLWNALCESVDRVADDPQTLIHRDTHAANWYRGGDGLMGIVDWQVAGRGSWATDVSYALACGLSIENRRAWERELLESYLHHLGERGVSAPRLDRAMTSYRQQMMHGFAYWVATIGLSFPQPKTQPDDACLASITRLARAVADHETLAALDR